jgi:uncharacterized protein involved in oxidation of intracellular sulfur
LRLAHALLKKDPDAGVTVFLMADAVVAARKGQRTPDGYYNVERMLKRVVAGKGGVLLRGTCMDARGMTDDDVMDGARRGSMDELAAATAAADKVVVFRAARRCRPPRAGRWPDGRISGHASDGASMSRTPSNGSPAPFGAERHVRHLMHFAVDIRREPCDEAPPEEVSGAPTA